MNFNAIKDRVQAHAISCVDECIEQCGHPGGEWRGEMLIGDVESLAELCAEHGLPTIPKDVIDHWEECWRDHWLARSPR